METIEFSPKTLAEIYCNSNAKGRQSIKNELGDKFSEILPVTERVKTFEDALAELGPDHEAVVTYDSIKWHLGEGNEDLAAYLKLRIITDALNEGWRPQFKNEERRWYPWYDLISKENYDDLSDERKSQVLLWGGAAGDGSRCGLAFADSSDAWSVSDAGVGSRLAFKSEELAEYAGRQFKEIYADFCFKPNVKNKD